jgi:hypothetical protein
MPYKIPWDDIRIPDWVTCAAVDKEGTLTFFEDGPYLNMFDYIWDTTTRYFQLPHFYTFDMLGVDWTKTLELRHGSKHTIKTEPEIKSKNTPEMEEYIKRLNLNPDIKYRFASDIMNGEEDD